MSVVRAMVLERRDEAKVEGLNEVMSQSNARIAGQARCCPRLAARIRWNLPEGRHRPGPVPHSFRSSTNGSCPQIVRRRIL